MITDNILYQDIQYGYVFRDNHGKFLYVTFERALGFEEPKVQSCDFEDKPVYYPDRDAARISEIVKSNKLKCKKYKVQISHTIELVAPKKPAVNKAGERLKKKA